MKKKLPPIIALVAAIVIVVVVYAVNHSGTTTTAKTDEASQDTSQNVVTADNGMAVTGVDNVDFWVTQNTEDGLRYSMTVGDNKAIIDVKLATDHDAQWYFDQDIAKFTANDQLFLEGEARYGDYVYKTINSDVANPKLYVDAQDGTTIIVELNDFVDISREDVQTILAGLGTANTNTETTTAE